MLDSLNQCPLCDSTEITPSKEVIDYAVTKETFTIWECASCSLLFTNPRPKAADIGPYYDFDDYYSHTDESRGVIANIYQKVKTYSIRQKIKQLDSLILQKGSLLDYGCGTGELIHQAQNHGWQVKGVEPNTKARNIASSKLPGQIVESTDFLDISDQFDIITLYHVLEHIHTLNKTVAQLLSKLKPNGFMLIAVPNPISPDSQAYDNHWAGWDVPRHLYHFTYSSILEFGKRNRLTLIQSSPLKFDSFYVSLLSEGYKNSQQHNAMIYSKAFIQGLKSNIKASGSNKPNYSSNLYIFQKL